MNDPRPAAVHAAPENLVRSMWQVAVYVLGAMLVGSWVWVWNTNNTLRDLQAALARVPEVMLRAEANRTVIDSYSERIAKLEESSRLSRDDRGRLHDQGHELRVAVDDIRRALSALQLNHASLTEMVHALVAGNSIRGEDAVRGGQAR